MLGLDVQPGKDRPGSADADHSDVVAVLGLTGDWGGSGEISCDSGLALEIARRMLMSDYNAVDEEVLDAVAEVANMIVGNIKTQLEEAVGPMGLSTPAVFFGDDFETRLAGQTPKVLVPFACTNGSLSVQLAIAPTAGAAYRTATVMERQRERLQ